MSKLLQTPSVSPWLTEHLQIHSKWLAPSNMGSSLTSPGKYPLRRQPQQYPVSPHKHFLQRNGLASVRNNTFWSACSVFHYHVRICCPRNSSGLRTKLWLDEPNRSGDTIDLSLFSTLVREKVWARARQLFDTWVTSRTGGYR